MKTKNLNFIEAHASGRKYKRSSQILYRRYTDTEEVPVYFAMANDFQLEPEPKQLTREEVRHAFNVSWDEATQRYAREVMLDHLFGKEDA